MTKKEASIAYYSTLFKLVEIFLLIVIDAFAFIPLYIGKYYAYSGIFVAFNIVVIKVGTEHFINVKNEPTVKELKLEDKNEERKAFFEAFVEGIRGLMITCIILASVFHYVINSINLEPLRLILILVTGFLTRTCLTVYLDKVRENYLSI